MADKLNVIAVSGSLRKASFNSSLLRECQRAVPDGMEIEIFDRVVEFPLYNDDDFKANGFPEAVATFRDKVAAADGFIIAGPEYNHSMSGTTKNLIDWGSRPDQVFAGKPIGIISATQGPLGGPWGQYATRQCFVSLDGRIMNQPEVLIGKAPDKFDEDGRLTDNAALDLVGLYLRNFVAWIQRHKS